MIVMRKFNNDKLMSLIQNRKFFLERQKKKKDKKKRQERDMT